MQEKEFINIIKRLTELFKNLITLFGELDTAVDNKDVDAVNKVVSKIKLLTKDISKAEDERISWSEKLAEKHGVKNNATSIVKAVNNEELTLALNSLIKTINDLLLKRQYTMNVLQSHLEYLNYSIDYFKQLLSFGNYDEKGKPSKYMNLLDREG